MSQFLFNAKCSRVHLLTARRRTWVSPGHGGCLWVLSLLLGCALGLLSSRLCPPRLRPTWALNAHRETALSSPALTHELERRNPSSSSDLIRSQRDHIATGALLERPRDWSRAIAAFCRTQRRCLPHCCYLSLIAQ